MFDDHEEFGDKDRHIFIQRSISAPPVAEHVSESSLAMYNMYDVSYWCILQSPVMYVAVDRNTH